MPSSKNYVRNYDEEYARYQSKDKQKKRRAQRNSARRKAVADGRARLGDGKDVDHITNDTASKRVRVVSKSTNRSFPRNKDGSVLKKKKGGGGGRSNSKKR